MEKNHPNEVAPDYMAHKFIAERAYFYWEERGRPFGSATVDWFNAIEDIRREMIQASGTLETTAR